MKIKDGYNSKEMNLRVYSQSSGSVEMWIEHPDLFNGREVLIYLTPAELLELFKEIQAAGKDLFN